MQRPSQAGRVWCGVLDLKRGEKGMQWGWGGSTGRLVKYTGGGWISCRCMLSIMGASNSVGEGSYKYWKGENWNEPCEVKIWSINVNSWILKNIDTYIERYYRCKIHACVFICILMCLRFFVHKEGEGAWEQQYLRGNEFITSLDLGFLIRFSTTRNPSFLDKWLIIGLEQRSLKWTWNILCKEVFKDAAGISVGHECQFEGAPTGQMWGKFIIRISEVIVIK